MWQVEGLSVDCCGPTAEVLVAGGADCVPRNIRIGQGDGEMGQGRVGMQWRGLGVRRTGVLMALGGLVDEVLRMDVDVPR